jgi:hypothetical protein
MITCLLNAFRITTDLAYRLFFFFISYVQQILIIILRQDYLGKIYIQKDLGISDSYI